jgi:osmotically-inducible protein OsmY
MPIRFDTNKGGRFGSVAMAADDRLRRSPYVGTARVSCEYTRGVLLLRGRLPSYYQKQVAQEAVRGLAGVVEILNEIEVARDRDSSHGVQGFGSDQTLGRTG